MFPVKWLQKQSVRRCCGTGGGGGGTPLSLHRGGVVVGDVHPLTWAQYTRSGSDIDVCIATR